MKKTVSVNISGVSFTMDEDAYQMLSDYLEALRNAFGNNEDASEISQDIEMRIAELLLAREKGTDRIVTISEVEQLIARMGRPEDFIETSEDVKDNEEILDEESVEVVLPPEPPQPRKQLFRSSTNKYIGGVCAGLAAYLGIDPTLVRLIAVGLCFVSFGTMLLIYLILWAIIPEARTPLERLAMEGRPVTLASIGRSVRNEFVGVSEAKEKSGVGSGIAKFCAILAKIILVILGLCALPLLLLLCFILTTILSALIGLVFDIDAINNVLPNIPFYSSFARAGIACALSWVMTVSIPLIFFISSVFGKTHPRLQLGQKAKNILLIVWIICAVIACVTTRKMYRQIQNADFQEIEDIRINADRIRDSHDKAKEILIINTDQSLGSDTVMNKKV